MPSIPVAWVLPSEPLDIQQCCIFVEFDVRLPYDKRRARLISIRNRLIKRKVASFSKLITVKLGNLFQTSSSGRAEANVFK